MVTKKDLKDAPGDSFLICEQCNERYSAHPGDYWYVEDDHGFVCNTCGEPMCLATPVHTYTVIKS